MNRKTVIALACGLLPFTAALANTELVIATVNNRQMIEMGPNRASRDLGAGDRIDFHLDAQGSLVGMSAWGQVTRSAREFKLARLLVERRLAIDPLALADPAVKLKSLLTSTAVAARTGRC